MEQPFMFTHLTHLENFTVFDTKWIPQTAKFVAIGGRTNATGLIKVYELNGNHIDLVREINKKNTFKCAAFGLSRTKTAYLAIGDFGGSLQIINVDRLDGCVYTVSNAHSGLINAIDTAGGVENKGASEILTGGQDGLVKVFDPRCTDAVIQIEPTRNNVNGGATRDCWSVAFGDSFNGNERCVCAGYDNGDIRVFDLRILRLRWQSNVRDGVCSLEANNKYEPLEKLVASTTFGGLNVFDFSKGDDPSQVSCISKLDADELPSIQRNHINDKHSKEITPTIWCVRHLPQNRNIFATCGGSGNVRIWHCPTPSSSTTTTLSSSSSNALKTIYEQSVSNKPVNCFDWNSDRAGLAVCSSFDKTLRIIASINLPLGQ